MIRTSPPPIRIVPCTPARRARHALRGRAGRTWRGGLEPAGRAGGAFRRLTLFPAAGSHLALPRRRRRRPLWERRPWPAAPPGASGDQGAARGAAGGAFPGERLPGECALAGLRRRERAAALHVGGRRARGGGGAPPVACAATAGGDAGPLPPAGSAGSDWMLVEVDGKALRAAPGAGSERIEEVLSAAGLRLAEEDRVEILPAEAGRPGRAVVRRAVPFSLVDGGAPTTLGPPRPPWGRPSPPRAWPSIPRTPCSPRWRPLWPLVCGWPSSAPGR